MASKVGLILALDGERQFSKELRSASETVKLAKSALSSLDEKNRGSANTFDALTERSKALATAQDAVNKKLKAATDGQAKANENYDKISSRLSRVRETLEYTKKTAEATKDAFGASSPEYKAYDELIKDLAEDEASLAHEQDRQQKSVLRWTTAVNKAETELRQVNAEIGKNDKYLSEAADSADGCATSIDAFGKEVKDTGKAMEDTAKDAEKFGDILEEKLMKQFTKEKIFDLVVAGLRRIGQAAVDATKEMVQVGMKFNKQMSRVAAISGASSSEMTKLTKKAMDLGKSTVYTAEEAGSAMEQLSLAGWRTEAIIGGIDGVLSLASASGMDLGQAAEYVSDNLNAFGREASYASKLSDIMAYAMSNSSMTTEDLGEAYEKVAATAHAYGYAETEVTAVLMTMANAGRKGGEAGTSLNTIMTRLATNTSKCSKAIAEYNGGQDIMYDSYGKMRPLTNVLEDLHDVWVDLDDAQRNALAKQIAGTRQSNALFSVMAGMEEKVGSTARSFSEYAKELENCEGAAKNMADVSLNNLSGDVELLGDAVDGLYITLEGKIDRGLRAVVQDITDFINGITSAISEQKSELGEFVEEIEQQDEAVNKLLNKSNGTIEAADTDYATLEAYKDLLKEVNGEEELSEFQKFRVSRAVEALADKIPELTKAWDEQRGVLKLADQELDELFADAERNAVQTAFLSAVSDDYNALAQAKVNTAMATSALINAQDAYNDKMEEYQAAEDKHDGSVNGLDIELQQLKATLDAAQGTFDDTAETEKNAADQVDAHKKAYEEYAKAQGWVIDNADDLSKAEGTVEGAMVDADEDLVNQIEDLEALAEAEEAAAKQAEEAAQELVKAYESMREGIGNSIESTISLTKKWEQGDSVGVHTMVENLESQIKGVEKWEANMIKLAEATGDGFSQSLYDKLAEMGPEGANLVEDIVKAMEEGSADFDRLSELWGQATQLDESSSVQRIAEATTAGKDVAEALKNGTLEELEGFGEYINPKVEAGLKFVSEQSKGDASKGGLLTADEFVNAMATGTMGGAPKVSSAAKVLSDSAVSGAGDVSGSFSGKGEDAAAGYAQGIRSGTAGAVSAAIEMVQKALAAVQVAQDSHSPSKKYAKLGKDATSGYAQGIDKGTSKAKKSAATMAKEALREANKALKDTGFTTKQAKEISKKISNAFNVSWYTGTGKKKKKKEVETYYSDVMRAAKKFADNKKVLNDWSLKQEEAYWKRVLLKLKKGTQAWYDAKKEINKLKKDIQSERADNQNKILDYYKTYRNVSLKAEMDYWNKARKEFKKGTDLRIEADKKYLEAKDAYYSELISLEEDYRDEYNNISDELKGTIQDLTDNYKNSVNSTRDSILSSMNIFEEFTSEGFKPQKLIQNLQSQVDALELWEEKLQELKERGISQDLYNILSAEGPSGVANVYSISQMTDEELAAYEALLKKKSQLATQQAIKDNQFLLADTNRQIAEANKVADEAFKELERKYAEAIAKIGADAPKELMSELSKAGTTPSDAIAAMFKNYNAIKSSDNTIEKLATDVADRLKAIVPATEDVGKQALESFLDAMTDDVIITQGAHKIVGELKNAIMYAGRDISFADSMLQEKVARVGITGTAALNDLMSQGNQQPVINVDNSSMSAVLSQALVQFSSLVDTISNLKVVLDSGATVGALTDQMNTSLGSAYASSNRGTLR